MQKVLLLILDGWGASDEAEGNAIKAANTPFYDELLEKYPNTRLTAMGELVGLPAGVMGNSEVGHENIGAGRIVKQKLTMISELIKTGEFFKNQELKKAFEHAKKNNSKIHFIGLISEGDVHSHLGHLDGLIEMSKHEGLEPNKVFLHAISDGRDDPPYVAEKLMARYEDQIQIASLAGRYWAMDRDNNWDRVEKYFKTILKDLNPNSKCQKANSATEAVKQGYRLAKDGVNTIGDSDEFILPTLINDGGLIENGDSIIFFNFRPDRARQISMLFEYFSSTDDKQRQNLLDNPVFNGDEKSADSLVRDLKLNLSKTNYTCLTEYANPLKLPIAFKKSDLPEQDTSLNLGELISNAGYRQLRAAETEKFNHVTSFFNTGHKEPYLSEDRKLIPSPKVKTYDLKPEMSLPELSKELIQALKNSEKDYKLVVCNFANPDMVGHTGNWDAVIEALEYVDKVLKKVIETAIEENYVVLLTADHGNADQMAEADGKTRTAHSLNKVPFLLINSKLGKGLKDEEELSLANIAPTALEHLDIAKPEQMSAKSLLV